MLDKIIHLDWVLILGIGWATCEILVQIPSVKSNSAFQLIYNGMKAIKEKFIPAKPQL